MDFPKLIILIGFFAVVISLGVKNYKKDNRTNKNISEYVFILFAIFLGAIVAYPYYSDFMPIALWSAVTGAIAALIVEARRRKRSKD